MNYKELISDIKELQKDITIIEGVVDIQEEKHSYNLDYIIRNCENGFWVILGNASEEEIIECLKSDSFDKRNDGLIGEGEYHFEAVLKYDQVDDYKGYWYIEYIEFHFHQTLLERDREEKLSKLFDDDMDIFS
jgi:hypothetical protein